MVTSQDMVNVFNTNIANALDEVAPIKSFTVKTHYKFELSNQTKDMMEKRDLCRLQMKGSSTSKRLILHQQYKTLWNKVTAMIRKDNLNSNKILEKLFRENKASPLLKTPEKDFQCSRADLWVLVTYTDI